MAYNKGPANKINAMASKSCNGTGARTLYTPMTATYAVSNRQYIITLTVACYFGTRINVDVDFINMTINGDATQNVSIDSWVSSTEPGKVFITKTYTGNFLATGKPDVKKHLFTLGGTMQYYADVSCTQLKTIPFTNSVEIEIADISPSYTPAAVPTLSNTQTGDNFVYGTISVANYGEGGGGQMWVSARKTNSQTAIRTSDVIVEPTLSGNYRLSNLQRNTAYKIKGIATNGGGVQQASSEITIATLAASEVMKAFAREANGTVYLETQVIIYNGGAKYAPTTHIETSDDLSTWTSIDSTNSKSVYTSNISFSGETGDVLYVRTRTVTTAGTYTSAYKRVTIGSNDGVWGYINTISPAQTSAVINSIVRSSESGSVRADIYYRIAGMEEEWIKHGSTTVTCVADTEQSFSYTLNGLNQNVFEYEVSIDYVRTTPTAAEFTTDSMSFFTVPIIYSNRTCDSIQYLEQLICQELNEIKHGNITVYMNDDTKKWCEDEKDDLPTVASMMSRINRFMHAVGCTLCSMEGFIEVMKESNDKQVYMGKLGWVDVDDEVTENSVNPVFSGAVHTAVDDLIHKVWHYFGEYDFYGYDLADLQAQTGTANNQTGIVHNKVYKWNGSAWANPETIEPEDFGVIHVKYGLHADKAYYWFFEKWHRLDADTEEIENRIEALEDITIINTFDDENYVLAYANSTMTDAEISAAIPTDATRDTIILILEDEINGD